MNWQEYQEAVARLYEQAKGIGDVRRNVYVPDKVTGQPRQIDVLIEIKAKGHSIHILVDAKFREGKLDVKDIEEVIALATATGANKSVVVASNGWSKSAETKAQFADVDLLLLPIDEALDLIVEDKWQLCPECERDCIVLEHEVGLEIDGGISVFLGGQCRECRLAFIWCWACGTQDYLPVGSSAICDCGHEWRCTKETIQLRLAGEEEYVVL